MKNCRVTFISVFFIFISFIGCKRYEITKTDFVSQFKNGFNKKEIICNDKNGKRILVDTKSSRIRIESQSALLNSISIINDSVVFKSSQFQKTTNKKSLNDLTKINLIVDFPIERKYINEDSVIKRVSELNDSLKKTFKKTCFIKITDKKNDSISIIEGVCYNLVLNQKKKYNHSAIERVTSDSIYFYNYFNENIAKKLNNNYLLIGYKLNEIKKIILFKTDSKNSTLVEVHNSTFKCTEAIELKPFYVWNTNSQHIEFYRYEFANTGFQLITERDGEIFWK